MKAKIARLFSGSVLVRFAVAALTIVALAATLSSTALAAPAKGPAHAGGFSSHIISSFDTKSLPIGVSATTPAPNTIIGGGGGGPCLETYMALSNPNPQIVLVYVQVLNQCGGTATNFTVQWDTYVTCNGVDYPGPSLNPTDYGSLANGQLWQRYWGFSAACYSPDFNLIPFQIWGFVAVQGTVNGQNAYGADTTQPYTSF